MLIIYKTKYLLYNNIKSLKKKKKYKKKKNNFL